MANQTDQKDKNNRGKMTEEELKNALRPIWQGWQFQDRTFLKDHEYEQSIQRVRELLDEDTSDEAKEPRQ